jgi:hypothetical protein
MPAFARVIVEIHVRLQRLSAFVLVRSAAEIKWVVQQVLYARNFFDDRQEFALLNCAIQTLIRFSQFADVLERRFESRLSIVADTIACIELREFAE